MKKYIGRIHVKKDIEKLGHQNEYIIVKASEDNFGYYLSLIAVLFSSFSLGISVVFLLFKLL